MGQLARPLQPCACGVSKRSERDSSDAPVFGPQKLTLPIASVTSTPDLRAGDALPVMVSLIEVPPRGPRLSVIGPDGRELCTLPPEAARSAAHERHLVSRAFARVVEPPSDGKLTLELHPLPDDEPTRRRLAQITALHLRTQVGDESLAIRLANRLYSL